MLSTHSKPADLPAPGFGQTCMEMVASIVTAYLSGHSVPQDKLPHLISSVHEALSLAGQAASGPERKFTAHPAVDPAQSVLDQSIICLECGKPFRSLKRHLKNSHGLAPQDYRNRWSLSSDYPMTAPGYAEVRSGIAKKMRLGHKRVALDA